MTQLDISKTLDVLKEARSLDEACKLLNMSHQEFEALIGALLSHGILIECRLCSKCTSRCRMKLYLLKT